MDDLRYYEDLEEKKNPDFMKTKIPVFTSKAYPEYPFMVDYPLEKVLDFHKIGYFSETIAYAVAFAIMCEVKELHFYGTDYLTFEQYEQGNRGDEIGTRAGTEFWCGVAHARGVKLLRHTNSEFLKPQNSNPDIMDNFYGYVKKSFPLVA